MAKKTAVRKPKRRLKKTARRSMAAVLMITAIVVAAIPVPENFADNPGARAGEEVVSPTAYVDGKDAGLLGTALKNNYVLPYTGPEVPGQAITTKEELEEYVIAPAVENGDVVATEIATYRGSVLYLTWQFIYAPVGANNGRVLNYNDEFPVDLVDLGLQPNRSYFAVYQKAYNAYFEEPENLITTSNIPEGADRQMQLLNMDNLRKSGDDTMGYTYADFYPTVPVVFTYKDYDSLTGQVTLDEKYQKYFETYFAADYERMTASVKGFWDEYDRLRSSANQEDKDRAAQMIDPADPLGVQPAPLSRAPADLDSAGRITFFCDHNRVLKGTGYTLELAADARLDADPETWVYVAHGGNAAELLDYKDDGNGYLVGRESVTLTSIGYRAFAGTHNVRQIKIDENVRTIEQSAFEGARISSVSIGNANEIGDRAFYNCIDLKEVTFTDTAPTDRIGVEAFYGSGINTKLTLPSVLTSIAHGAFANCPDLSEVEFADTGLPCSVDDYAFYGDNRLSNVNFGRIRFENIGKCAFAIAAPSGDVMTDFHFPSEGLVTMDDYILANRRGLKNVYIENYTRKVPTNTFYNCFGLVEARFSDQCGAATFDKDLFKDVTEDSFCVYGPELYAGQPAGPRTSTWDAVRTDGKGIPYVYEKDGKKHYEMALESNGTRYRYSASEDGELISCALITKNSGKVDLVIPDKIGNIKISKIGPGCFDDKDLREAIKSITIKNNSVEEIGDGVFRDLENLQRVRIGDSVTSIGANAFAGCSQLYDVYFTKPAAGHSALKIGTDAFVTTGDHLTFHGDIVKGYAPFDLAMTPGNVLRDPDRPSLPAVNICYQSLWDSEQGAHLTVLPDKSTGEVTLLDYPKFKDLENFATDDELQDFCREMEDYYYYTVYNTDSEEINRMRQEYADIFDAQRTGKGSVTLPGGATIVEEDFAEELDKRYGPWINPIYCGGAWVDYKSGQSGTAKNTVADFLFAPMVVEAADNPTPYFEAHPYDFMKNYENYLTMDPATYRALAEYQQVPEKVWNFIHATQDIYVPEGVDSIDVVSYMKSNGDNYNKYIKNRPADTMYTTTLGGAVPGLFSGYYEDYEEGDDERENAVKGNDTIQSVILTSVKTLPDYAFDNCEQLRRVEIPAATKVGKLPFRDCENMIHLVGSEKYPAERGILYEKHEDADGNARYRIVECLMARGKSGSGNEELAVSTVSAANDSLLSLLCETCATDIVGDKKISIPAIAEDAFKGCKYVSIVDLSNSSGLKTIPQDAFKDCDRIGQVILPGSVNKIAEDAFTRTATSGTTHANVTIYGREVDIADNAFEPNSDFTIYSYEDSAAKRYTDRHPNIDFKILDAYRVWFYDYDGTPLGDSITVDKGVKIGEDIPEEAKVVTEANHRPGYSFVEWMSNDGKTTDDPIDSDMTIFVAQYKSDGTLVDGKCSVQFVHGRTGQTLRGYGTDESGRYLVEPGTSFSDPANNTQNGETLTPPPVVPNPTDDGYVFLNEYRTDSGEVWNPDTTPITRNITVLALFGQNGGNGNTSGGTTSNGTTSGNSGNNGGNSGNSSKNSSSDKSSSSSSSSTSSSSTSTTSTTTSGAGQYTVFVEGGSGSGSYAPGTTVIISCYVPADGMKFEKWTTESNGVALASTTMTTTTFTMPANNVTVKANYVEAPAAPAVAVNGGGGNSTTTSGNGSTQVDIEKPGISNRDLATANTNGSSDNFIVKISETDEATRAVAAALTNKYGTLDNILYYAMDISLYDSTGTTKITDTTGLTVDITIPIPDSLVAYGGNNMAGAVINGDQLESLNENFTTINGVPCIRFRAEHFSPYTIYVDTGNLVEGMLDVTPKTGDPIHPKWFLSLGLACLSVILFLKKDKKVKAKA